VSRARELVLCAALAACTKGTPGAGADAGADAHAGADAEADAHAGADAGAGAGADADAGAGADAFLSSPPRRAKSIGHTSVVFKVELANGAKAAFRPAYRRGPVRYKGEIAAYRLARALGLPNAPRAYPRTMSARALAAALGGPLPPEVLATGDDVKGAIVPWIDGLEFLALEKEPLASKWRASMKRGADVGDAALARQLAVMVGFDWLDGNWDRWSGGNVGSHPPSGTVLFIDNDGAFFETPPKDHLARQWRLLEGMDRFSRSFVLRVRALDPDALARAIGEESPGVPLLSDKALAGVEARRMALLALVDAKIGDAGDGETLYFP
jgi:hypothetical protein